MNITLLESKTPKVGKEFPTSKVNRQVQMTVLGKGPVSATAFVEVSNDQRGWLKVCLDMTVSGDATAEKPVTDCWPFFSSSWSYMRATVTDVQGEDAIVLINLGMQD